MITRQEIFDFVEGMIGATTDQPFADDFDSTVLRHSDDKKWFGIVMKAPRRYFYGKYEEGYCDVITLKCDPFLRELLSGTFGGIYPAYHMNKVHWVSIPLEGEFPKEETKKLILHSFELTAKANKANKGNKK